MGALVSAGITFLNSHLERRARREELFLSKAIDLAHERIRVVVEYGKAGHRVQIPPATSLAETYFRWLKNLIRYDQRGASSS